MSLVLLVINPKNYGFDQMIALDERSGDKSYCSPSSEDDKHISIRKPLAQQKRHRQNKNLSKLKFSKVKHFLSQLMSQANKFRLMMSLVLQLFGNKPKCWMQCRYDPALAKRSGDEMDCSSSSGDRGCFPVRKESAQLSTKIENKESVSLFLSFSYIVNCTNSAKRSSVLIRGFRGEPGLLLPCNVSLYAKKVVGLPYIFSSKPRQEKCRSVFQFYFRCLVTQNKHTPTPPLQ